MSGGCEGDGAKYVSQCTGEHGQHWSSGLVTSLSFIGVVESITSNFDA